MAAHKASNGIEKKRKSRKRQSRLEVSSSSESDGGVGTQKKRSPKLEVKQVTGEQASQDSPHRPTKKEKKKQKPIQEFDPDTAMADNVPVHLAAKDSGKTAFSQPLEDFGTIYLRKITTELADDLDKVREAQDFKASSVPMLIHALKQGESLFSAEEKKSVLTARIEQ